MSELVVEILMVVLVLVLRWERELVLLPFDGISGWVAVSAVGLDVGAKAVLT